MSPDDFGHSLPEGQKVTGKGTGTPTGKRLDELTRLKLGCTRYFTAQEPLWTL